MAHRPSFISQHWTTLCLSAYHFYSFLNWRTIQRVRQFTTEFTVLLGFRVVTQSGVTVEKATHKG